MLTNSDLESIRGIIRLEVREIVHEEVSIQIREAEERIKSELRTEFKKQLRKEVKKIWDELKFLRETMNFMIQTYEDSFIKIESVIGTVVRDGR